MPPSRKEPIFQRFFTILKIVVNSYVHLIMNPLPNPLPLAGEGITYLDEPLQTLREKLFKPYEKGCFLIIVSLRSGPVEIIETGIPINVDKRSTKSSAAFGRSSNFVIPFVEVFQPGSVS
jgi:hypothetical protein